MRRLASLLLLPVLLAAERPSIGAELVSTFVWRPAPAGVGGLSGVEVGDDGRGLTLLSDRGRVFTARIRRDAGGRIVAVDPEGSLVLRDARGRRPPAWAIDAEGLAEAADGRLCIAFEGIVRVDCYPPGGDRPVALPRPAVFRALAGNRALEALAVDREDRLWTLPESTPRSDARAPVWRFANGHWEGAGSIALEGGFVPVGADFGPGGRFWLLERRFSLFGGFASRVRVFRAGPEGLSAPRVVLETAPGVHDNLEGIAVWRGPDGRLRLLLVADDNFSLLQRTELVEYRLGAE